MGCSNLINFKKHELSGVKGQQAKIIVGFGEGYQDDSTIAIIQKDKNLHDALKSACQPEKATIFPGAIPFIAVGGKLLFDLVIEERIRQLKQLKIDSRKAYFAKTTLTSNELGICKCAVMVRHKDEKSVFKRIDKSQNTDPICEKLGLIAIVKFVKYETENNKYSEEAFWIEPVYIRACDALAVTADKKTPQIDLSIGIAIKAIGKKKNSGQPELFTIGEGAVSVKNVEIGIDNNTKPYECRDTCPQSELIPYPKADKDDALVSVALSVVEAGHVGINFDQRLAETEAIKEALGPAIEESLKAVFKEDE